MMEGSAEGPDASFSSWERALVQVFLSLQGIIFSFSFLEFFGQLLSNCVFTCGFFFSFLFFLWTHSLKRKLTSLQEAVSRSKNIKFKIWKHVRHTILPSFSQVQLLKNSLPTYSSLQLCLYLFYGKVASNFNLCYWLCILSCCFLLLLIF